jgi:hypothetical protein
MLLVEYAGADIKIYIDRWHNGMESFIEIAINVNNEFEVEVMQPCFLTQDFYSLDLWVLTCYLVMHV